MTDKEFFREQKRLDAEIATLRRQIDRVHRHKGKLWILLLIFAAWIVGIWS